MGPMQRSASWGLCVTHMHISAHLHLCGQAGAKMQSIQKLSAQSYSFSSEGHLHRRLGARFRITEAQPKIHRCRRFGFGSYAAILCGRAMGLSSHLCRDEQRKPCLDNKPQSHSFKSQPPVSLQEALPPLQTCAWCDTSTVSPLSDLRGEGAFLQ